LKLIIVSPSGLAMDDRGNHTSDSPQRKFATDPEEQHAEHFREIQEKYDRQIVEINEKIGALEQINA
jgi:wobble nucleotide-excising tRNase